MLNRIDPSVSRDEAVVEFLDGDFRVIKPGKFVRCAITKEPIPLDELRYWNVVRQEAYASRDAVLIGMGVKASP
jgi:hypothetical protein